MVYQSMHAVPVLDRLQASRLSLNHLGVLLRVAIRDCVALLALSIHNHSCVDRRGRNLQP